MRRYIIYFQIIMRSFFVQSGWNFKSLLSIGFCFSILPIAKRIYKNDISKYNQFVKRHLAFFNGHPYFVSFALGSVARLEEEVAIGRGDLVLLEKFKGALIGPLGALGDALFWATVKPATFTIGVLGFLIIDKLSAKLTFLILLGILYNAPHLYVRIKGMIKGYTDGFDICKYLKIENFRIIQGIYSFAGIVALGTIAGWIAAKRFDGDYAAFVVFMSSIGTAAFLKIKRSKTFLAMILPLLIALIVGFINSTL